MDDFRYRGEGYHAPGATPPGMRLEAPGAGRYSSPSTGRPMSKSPRICDHEVTPETRQEKVYGEVREAMPSLPPHSRVHNRLDYVLNGYVAPGYGVDTDLLTRYDEAWDFAPDTCVRRDGVAPESGCRYLEELAFEIAYKQSDREITDKARVMVRRGVRRVFVLRVRGDREGAVMAVGPLLEWIEEQQRWQPLPDEALIEDPCLHRPLPVRALLHGPAADDAVVAGLASKGNPALQRMIDAGRAEGYRAAAGMLRTILEQRGIALDDASRMRIEHCRDADVLQRWTARALHVTQVSELFAG